MENFSYWRKQKEIEKHKIRNKTFDSFVYYVRLLEFVLLFPTILVLHGYARAFTHIPTVTAIPTTFLVVVHPIWEKLDLRRGSFQHAWRVVVV